jgi:hypothetical protein
MTDEQPLWAYGADIFAACDAGGWPSSQATVDVLGELAFFVIEDGG